MGGQQDLRVTAIGHFETIGNAVCGCRDRRGCRCFCQGNARAQRRRNGRTDLRGFNCAGGGRCRVDHQACEDVVAGENVVSGTCQCATHGQRRRVTGKGADFVIRDRNLSNAERGVGNLDIPGVLDLERIGDGFAKLKFCRCYGRRRLGQCNIRLLICRNGHAIFGTVNSTATCDISGRRGRIGHIACVQVRLQRVICGRTCDGRPRRDFGGGTRNSGFVIRYRRRREGYITAVGEHIFVAER